MSQSKAMSRQVLLMLTILSFLFAPAKSLALWPQLSSMDLIGQEAAASPTSVVSSASSEKSGSSLQSNQLLANSGTSSISIFANMSSGLTKSLLPIDKSKLPNGVAIHIDEINVAKDGTPVAYISITVKKGSQIEPLLKELRTSKILPGANSFISMIGAIHKFSKKDAMVVRALIRLASPKKLIASQTIVGSDKRVKGAFNEHKLIVLEKVLQRGIDDLKKSESLKKDFSYYIKVPKFFSPYLPIPTGYRKIYRQGRVELKKVSVRCKEGHLAYYGKVKGFVAVATASRGVQINPSTFWGRIYPRKSAGAKTIQLRMKVTLWPKLDVGIPEVLRSLFASALHPTAMAITLLARSLVHKALRKKMAVELSGKKMEPTISRIDWHRFDASWGPVEADLTKLLCQLFGISFKGRVKNIEVKKGQIELTLTSAK